MKISALYKRYIRVVPGIRSYVMATFFVFIIGIVITLLSWYVDKQRIETQNTMQLNEQVSFLESDLKNRLAIYEQVLRGGSGLLNASNDVTRDDWRRYVQEYNLDKTYPGVSNIGYVQYVPAAMLESYTASVREGFPNFAIMPDGIRSEYAPITYLEPLNDMNKKVIGTDIYSDPKRLEFANRIRDTGTAGISERLVPQTDQSGSGSSGFLMYLPVYNKDTTTATAEERRANLRGFVFAGYRSSDFFKRAINTSTFTAYSDVQIFDGSNTNQNALLYQSEGFTNNEHIATTSAYTSSFFDRDWTFRFAGPIKNPNGDTQRSNMILIGGTTISFAIAGFLFLIMLTRARAIVYSKQNEAQQAKDDLLSLASHQLRTPATAVKQYLGMILEGYTGKVSKKQLPALQKAYASNERQLDTINQILYVAKADAGRLSINPGSFDINRLINDIVLDLADSLQENRQSVEVESSRKKIKVTADEASIRMIVENLLSNASKYSHPDSKITVKTAVKKGETSVSVIDQGVGISNDDYEKLFKKFSRIDNDLSLQVGGSGIGLYIDKVLIELHGGRIEVASELGTGSTFTIFLPLRPPNTASNLTDGTRTDSS